MHKGEIREMGTHQELLALGGIYYKLYQLQYKEQEIARRCTPIIATHTPLRTFPRASFVHPGWTASPVLTPLHHSTRQNRP